MRDHLEKYSDFANRLPRGRTYVRNGSVVDLQLGTGTVTAFVSGSGTSSPKPSESAAASSSREALRLEGKRVLKFVTS